MSPATLLEFAPAAPSVGAVDGPVQVTLGAPLGDRCRGLVEAEGFEFPFSAEVAGPDAWIAFTARSGIAGEVFARRESELREAARRALRRRRVA